MLRFRSKIVPTPSAFQKLHVLLIKDKEIHSFSNLFDKVLYMFRTGPLSIIRSLNTVFTAIGTCHASSVGCLLAWSGPC